MNDSPPFDQFAWVPVGMMVVVFVLWCCRPAPQPRADYWTSLPKNHKPSVEVVAR